MGGLRRYGIDTTPEREMNTSMGTVESRAVRRVGADVAEAKRCKSRHAADRASDLFLSGLAVVMASAPGSSTTSIAAALAATGFSQSVINYGRPVQQTHGSAAVPSAAGRAHPRRRHLHEERRRSRTRSRVGGLRC
jgi:hypothetical protein